MIRVGIVGASGYTGAELVRLLSAHPQVKIAAATSESFAGQALNEVYPALMAAGEIKLARFTDTHWSSTDMEAVFLALPHGEAQAVAPALLGAGLKVIDLSGDFRFAETPVYEQWYHRPHTAKELAPLAVYGLPELFRDQIRNARLVANPGCFVTAAVLALWPLVHEGWVDPSALIVDAKTGVSGAGRTPKPETIFTKISENVVPYKTTGTHQHTPEIEMVLKHAGHDVRVTLTPQLVPARRGILAMAYGRLQAEIEEQELNQLYQRHFGSEPFVRLLTSGWPDLGCTQGTNLCVVRPAVDLRTRTAVVAASLDNLIKGASGQAIQNLNLMFGLDETLGLPGVGSAV
jgi:N-acetyl-gamma-glutamyl-phosphate reductase